jgi:membrane protease YdiL (CAAX protease family)
MATVAHPRSQSSGLYRAGVFLLFVAGGLAIFLFGNNWTSRFATNHSDAYKWALPLLFGALSLALRGPRWAELRAITLALFSAALANAILAAAGHQVLELLPTPASAAQRLAIDKVAQAIVVIPTLIVLTMLIDRKLSAAFIARGNRWGLRFGLIAFTVFAAIFAVIAVVQAGGPRSVGLTASGVPLSALAAAAPWILVFIFTNSFMEELWFRGISIGKLRSVLGAGPAIVATALVFSSIHFAAVYVTDLQRMVFVAIAFALGLLNGYVMLRSESIWGSVLVHAGYDLFVIIPLLAQPL